MIAGYIDIILRMRSDTDRIVENDDDIALETEGYGINKQQTINNKQ